MCPQGLSAHSMDLKVTWPSSPHQQVSQGIQEKTSPEDERKGYDQVAVPPGLISWFQLLKTGAYLFVGKGTNFFFFIMRDDF